MNATGNSYRHRDERRVWDQPTVPDPDPALGVIWSANLHPLPVCRPTRDKHPVPAVQIAESDIVWTFEIGDLIERRHERRLRHGRNQPGPLHCEPGSNPSDHNRANEQRRLHSSVGHPATDASESVPGSQSVPGRRGLIGEEWQRQGSASRSLSMTATP